MKYDLSFSKLFAPIFSFLFGFVSFVFWLSFSVVVLFFGYFFIRYRLNPFHLCADQLRASNIRFKYYSLFRWFLVDYLERKKNPGEFREFGFTFFVGRQGAGKSISMVHYLDRIKAVYPRCVIVTNFKYHLADHVMVDWRDILNIRNGVEGVIFAIDEIHSEYSSASWKDVPESLLSEISQQRKQRVKIVATAQFFSRIAKPLREQGTTVVVCSTFCQRLTCTREYDAMNYAMVLDNPNAVKKKLRPIRKSSFVQSDFLRSCFDTYEKINRMKKIQFIDRDKRGGGTF